jgi:hypothetical protein
MSTFEVIAVPSSTRFAELAEQPRSRTPDFTNGSWVESSHKPDNGDGSSETSYLNTYSTVGHEQMARLGCYVKMNKDTGVPMRNISAKYVFYVKETDGDGVETYHQCYHVEALNVPKALTLDDSGLVAQIGTGRGFLTPGTDDNGSNVVTAGRDALARLQHGITKIAYDVVTFFSPV